MLAAIPNTPQSDQRAERSNVPIKYYRGTISSKAVEMQLRFDGETITGSYFYLHVGKPLALQGKLGAGDRILLQEFDAANKATGKFICQYRADEFLDGVNVITGQWMRPDGSAQTDVSLNEQNIEFTNKVKVTTKTIKEPRRSINVAYPQLVGGTAPGIAKFNASVAARLAREVQAYRTETADHNRGYFEADYNILIATDQFISVEVNAGVFYGGPYPNAYNYSFNFDLLTGRELTLQDLFKAGSNYRPIILREAKKSVAEKLRKNENEAGNDDVSGWDSDFNWQLWAMSPKGLVVFYELPHVIEAMERNFIPYSALQPIIKPGSPIDLLARRKQ